MSRARHVIRWCLLLVAGGAALFAMAPGPLELLTEPSIADYGAVADDAKDCTAAVQKALNECAAVGVPLKVPPGTYRITGQLTIPGGTTLLGVPGLSALHWVLPRTGAVSMAKCMLIPTGSQGVRLRGLTIRGDIVDAAAGTVPQFGVYADNSLTGVQTANVTIDSCEFTGLTGVAFSGNNLGTTSGLVVTNCQIHDIGVKAQNVASLVHAGLGCPQASDVLFSGNDIYNIGSGSSLDHAIYASRSISRLRIIGNTFRTNGIQIDGSGKVFRDIVIAHNTINPITDGGIILGGALSNFTVSGNTITLGGGAAGIQLYNCGLGVVDGNSINMNGQVAFGVSITGAQNVTIAANTIYGPSGTAGTAGILAQDNMLISRVKITGNFISMGTSLGNINQIGVWFYSHPSGAGMSDCTVDSNMIVNSTVGAMFQAPKKIGRTLVANNHFLDCRKAVYPYGPDANTSEIIQAGNVSR